jgi:hypothetical protein
LALKGSLGRMTVGFGTSLSVTETCSRPLG